MGRLTTTNMHIKIATSILGLLLPWVPMTPSETFQEPVIQMPLIAQVEPLPPSDAQPQIALEKVPVPAPVAPPVAQSVIPGCGDNFYANFIYMHESGCNVAAVNSIGCRGIGQACPGSKLPCGADYACQNAYFTQYANSRGGWAASYAFWLSHGWW